MRPDQVLVLVTARLTALGIPYCVGGSFASSAYGRARTTFDLDVLIALSEPDIPALISAFQHDFDLNPSELLDACQHAPGMQSHPELRALAKAYHKATQFRVDFFISSGRPFERMQLERGITQVIATNPDAEAVFASPEDIMLAKLEWFRIGNYASANQWVDVQAIISVRRAQLDWSYLRHWAEQLHVTELLDLAASGSPQPMPPGTGGDPAQQRLFD